MRNTLTAGRGWAYLGITLGGLVSIAANVAHSYVPPLGAPLGWTPPAGAVVSAFFWPIFLFLALEILARTRWPKGWGWLALRFLGLLPVAIVAGVVSYRHLSGLLTFYGEDPLTATIGPLAVDGLMVVATGALIATSTHRVAKPAGPSTTVDTQPVDLAPPPPIEAPPLPAHLLPTARFATITHQQTTGRAITGDELAARLNIPTTTAGQLLTALAAEDGIPAPVNGATLAEATR